MSELARERAGEGVSWRVSSWRVSELARERAGE